MNDKKILVTGAGGFLGSCMMRTLAESWEMIGTYHRQPLSYPGAQMVDLEITDFAALASLLDEQRPRAVIHLAALTNVDQGQSATGRMEQVNVRATGELARLCKQREIRLVYASTDLVYGQGDGPHIETETVTPLSHYARTKYEGEERLIETGGDFVICRIANMYGPPGPTSNSFSDWLTAGFTGGKKLPLYHDQFRSFLNTFDAARVLAELIEKAPAGEVYNLGGPQRLSRVEFGKLFAEVFGYDAGLIEPTSLADDDKGMLRGFDCSLDLTKLTDLIDYRLHSVKDALVHWTGGVDNRR